MEDNPPDNASPKLWSAIPILALDPECVVLPVNTVIPLVYVPAVPLTSKREFGFVAPIPTLPSPWIRTLSVPDPVLNWIPSLEAP